MIDTDTLQTIPCKDCYEFKTVLVTTYNIGNFFFSYYKPVQKKVSEFGQVKVWYCKKQQQHNLAYITKDYAYMLTSGTCPYKNV